MWTRAFPKPIGQWSFVDGLKISPVTIRDLHLSEHRSVRLAVAVREDARHLGGIYIFGRGFGKYDQDIVLRLTARR